MCLLRRIYTPNDGGDKYSILPMCSGGGGYAALQPRQKWQRPKTDIRTGDVVLVADENTPRGQWPLGRVTEVKKDRDGRVRSCVIKSRTSQIVRPVTKLCLLVSSV